MNHEGPALETLLRRMSECPDDFWNPGWVSSNSMPHSRKSSSADLEFAILCDQMRTLSDDFTPKGFLEDFSEKTTNERTLLCIVAWLLCDEWFNQRGNLVEGILRLYRDPKWSELALQIPASQFVNDPDRREELVRNCLSMLDLRPLGETIVQALDRLTTLDSVEREKVLRATLAAEQRARSIREAMAQAKAMESSSRYGE